MAKLTTKQRNALPASAFAGPGRSYPINDKGHAAFAIRVASIQHAKGNLSAAQLRAIHAKASRVLHAKDGGAVRSNTSDHFACKEAMRMADGGIIAQRMQKMEQMAGAPAPAPAPPPEPAPAAAAPAPAPAPAPMSAEEISLRQKYGMMPAPKPAGMFDTIKKKLGFADGGPVATTFDELGKREGFPTMPSSPTYSYTESNTPLPGAAPAMSMRQTNGGPQVNWGRAWDQVKAAFGFSQAPALYTPAQMIGVRGADGGETHDITLRSMIRNGEFHAGEGEVRGPGGPKDDKVPAMLSNGEYVLPADVVEKIGKEKLDDIVEDNHNYGAPKKPGHYADGSPPSLRTPYVEPPVRPIVQPGIPSAEAAQYVVNKGPIAKGGGAPLPSSAPAVDAAPAAAAPEAAASTSQLGRMATTGGRLLGTAARRVGPWAAGAAYAAPLAGFGDYKINDPEVDSSAGETMRLMGNRLRDMWNGTALPEDRAAGRANLSKGLVEAGLDSASGLAKTADFATGLVGVHPDFSGRLRERVQQDLGGQVTLPPERTPLGPKAAPVTIDNATGDVVDDGGALNVQRAGDQVSITGDRATRSVPLFTPEERASLRRAQYAPTQYGPSIGDQNDEAFARLRGEFNRPDEGTWSGTVAARNARRVAAQERDLAQRERESVRTAGTSMRGQDMTAATARAQARIEQMNKDRQFAFDTAKAFGTGGEGATGGEVGRAEQRARQEADAAVHTKISNLLPPTVGVDGKPAPDTATAARYMTGLNAMLGQKIAQAEAHLKKNPGDAATRAWLNKAHAQGIAAIQEDDLRKFVTGMQAADVAQQEHSLWNPVKGTAVVSDAPVESLRRRPGFIFDDYVTNRGDVIPARALDKPGSTLGLGGQQGRNYDILKRQ